jgi:hypothetical protein
VIVGLAVDVFISSDVAIFSSRGRSREMLTSRRDCATDQLKTPSSCQSDAKVALLNGLFILDGPCFATCRGYLRHNALPSMAARYA